MNIFSRSCTARVCSINTIFPDPRGDGIYLGHKGTNGQRTKGQRDKVTKGQRNKGHRDNGKKSEKGAEKVKKGKKGKQVKKVKK